MSDHKYVIKFDLGAEGACHATTLRTRAVSTRVSLIYQSHTECRVGNWGHHQGHHYPSIGRFRDGTPSLKRILKNSSIGSSKQTNRRLNFTSEQNTVKNNTEPNKTNSQISKAVMPKTILVWPIRREKEEGVVGVWDKWWELQWLW